MEQLDISSSELSVFDSNAVVILDDLSVKDITKLDKDVFKAIDLFNKNQFNKAIEMLENKSEKDAIHGMALGCLLFMRAISTFNKDDIDKATSALEMAAMVADQQNTKKSGFFKKLLLFSSDEMHWINARSFTITAESNMLSAFLFVFQESVSGLIKAGLYLTKGVRGVEEVYQWYKQIPTDELETNIDENTKAGILFLIGAVQLATALLPPKVLKLISIFGYTSNMKLGYELMHEAEESKSFYSDLASIFLLGIHSILLSFAPGTVAQQQCITMNERLEKCRAKYPQGVFYLILSSRFRRSERNLNEASVILEKAINIQDEWMGLKYLASFELCMTNLFLSKYDLVFEAMDVLQKATFWSKAFFSYCQGACLDMMDKDGSEKYTESLTFINRKFGGKTIAIEQFVTKRVQYFQTLESANGYSVEQRRRLILPGLEIAFLFLGFSFMGIEQLNNAMTQINQNLKVAKDLDDSHLRNHLNLLKCAVQRNINIINKTYDLSILGLVEPIESDQMDWIKPFSVFEQGQLHVDAYLITKKDVYLARAKELLTQASEYSGFVLEFRYFYANID